MNEAGSLLAFYGLSVVLFIGYIGAIVIILRGRKR